MSQKVGGRLNVATMAWFAFIVIVSGTAWPAATPSTVQPVKTLSPIACGIRLTEAPAGCAPLPGITVPAPEPSVETCRVNSGTARRTSEWRAPPATTRAPVSPGTCTGSVTVVGSVTPTCPFPFSPQARTVPSFRTARP